MIDLLNKTHNRKSFDCRIPALNDYLKIQAGQDMRRKLSACFVITQTENSDVLGYYTLSNYSIPPTHFPESVRKKFPPNYNSIPVTLLGRLAVNGNQKGKGLGKILLIDALRRTYEASLEIGSLAVVVDPIKQEAMEFYRKYDFVLLPDSGKMMIGMKILGELFGEN
jgi:predicted GNAT family N-acyltransferase